MCPKHKYIKTWTQSTNNKSKGPYQIHHGYCCALRRYKSELAKTQINIRWQHRIQIFVLLHNLFTLHNIASTRPHKESLTQCLWRSGASSKSASKSLLLFFFSLSPAFVQFVNNNLSHSMKEKKKTCWCLSYIDIKKMQYIVVSQKPFLLLARWKVSLGRWLWLWHFLKPFSCFFFSPCTDLYHTSRLIPSLIHSHVSSGTLVYAGSQSSVKETQGRGEPALSTMPWRQQQ